MPPWGLCFWRLTLACAILLPIVHHHHDAMIGLLRTRAAEVIAVGAIGLPLCQAMICHGLTDPAPPTPVFIMALSPFMTMVLARFVLGEPLGLWKSLGALV